MIGTSELLDFFIQNGHFQVHVEAVSGISDDSQMGEGVWGVLKGRVVRYLLRGETILIGRNTQFHSVCYYHNYNK